MIILRGLPLLRLLLLAVTTSTVPSGAAPPAAAPIWLGILRLTPRLHADAAWTDADNKAVRDHFVRLQSATHTGTVILAGRTQEPGDRTLGLVLFKASDEAAATTFMREDPAVANGVMTMEVRPYSLALLRDPGRVAAGNDLTAISEPAMDYALGCYEGNATRMERALHPEFVRREVVKPSDQPAIASVGALQLIRETNDGVGAKAASERRLELRVLDRWQDMAMVRLELSDGVDYLQLARVGEGRWQIAQVLRQSRKSAPLERN